MRHSPSALLFHDFSEEGSEVAIRKESVCPQPVCDEEDNPAGWGGVRGRVSVVDSDHRGLEVDVKHGEQKDEVHDHREDNRDCILKHIFQRFISSWIGVSEKDYKYFMK